MADERRFRHSNHEEIKNKRVNTTPKNSLKTILKAARAFRDYLTESDEFDDSNFESFTADKQNDALGRLLVSIGIVFVIDRRFINKITEFMYTQKDKFVATCLFSRNTGNI